MLRHLTIVRTGLWLAVSAASLAACDDQASGVVRVAWSTPLANPSGGWHGWPAISQNTAVVEDGPALLALDVASGAVRWRTTLRQGIPVNAEAIAIAGNRVFTAAGDSVYALALGDGQRLWAFLPAAQAAQCQLSADSGAVYVGTRSHVLYALDAGTGAIRWSVDLGPGWAYTGMVMGTAVSGDTVYAAVPQELNASGTQRVGHVVALDRASGTELWRYTTPGQQFEVSGAPAIAGSLLLLGDGNAPGYFAVDRTTGQLAWRIATAAGLLGVVSTPAWNGTRAFAASQGGAYAADLTSGTPVWTRQDTELLGGTSASFCNGILLVQNQAVAPLSANDGHSVGPRLLDDNASFPTSRIVAQGDRAIVTGTQAVYGLRC